MALKSGLANLQQVNSRNALSNLNVDLNSLQGKFISARVTSINQSGGGDNGVLQCELLDQIKFNGSNIVQNVQSLFPNIKNYPLVNEVIMIVALANKEYQDDYNNLSWYYLNPINLWNSPQSNPLPPPQYNTSPATQKKGYRQVEIVGSPNKPSAGTNEEFKAGTYFEEKSDINPTYPYEGDFILDGRFGNSIRLGNTVPNGTTLVPNNWSSAGLLGDPITILSNRHRTLKPSYSFITEDINSDYSSIYLTSTQKIPINVASKGYYSYNLSNSIFTLEPPITPAQYRGEQVILNSGRILLNSYNDHLLLSSQNSINLNAKESINFDTIGPVVIGGAQVLLGGASAQESVLLGDSTIDTLGSLIGDLKTLFNIIAIQLGNNGILLEPTNSTVRTLVNNLDIYLSQLDGLKSQIVKVE
jgi:hypothetical protein